jgi:hypothetical protein
MLRQSWKTLQADGSTVTDMTVQANILRQYFHVPSTVAARSKALNVLVRSNAGIVGLNPTRGIDVCVRLFCV